MNPENNNQNQGKAAYLNIASSITATFNCCRNFKYESNRNANINMPSIEKTPSNSEDIVVDIKEALQEAPNENDENAAMHE